MFANTFKAHLDRDSSAKVDDQRKEGITVAKATEHLSKLFGMAGRAFRLLEVDGVSVIDFLQRLIDDPPFRAEIVKLAKSAQLFRLPRVPSKNGIGQLMHDLFGDTEAHEYDAYYESYERLRRLLDVLTAGDESLVVVRFGLADGKCRSYGDVAEYHGLSFDDVEAHVGPALGQLRARHEELRLPALDDEAPIEVLNLSERARNCLRRARIDTIGQLRDKSTYDLFCLINISETCVREIIAKLDGRGLSLKSK